jgi:hypothetical protein
MGNEIMTMSAGTAMKANARQLLLYGGQAQAVQRDLCQARLELATAGDQQAAAALLDQGRREILRFAE